MIPHGDAILSIPRGLHDLAVPYLSAFILIPIIFIFYLSSWPAKKAHVKPRRASPFKPELVPPKIDTIVIGSGSGGCTCANLLAQMGHRVLILEQHETRTGGCTHSFREQGCEWDTGLHYTSAAMGQKTKRPGALLHFMMKGLQGWTKLEDPYDEVLFPEDSHVSDGAPNASSYQFVSGLEKTVDSVMMKIEPENEQLKNRAIVWMELCKDINDGFTALGLSRVLPSPLHFLVQARIDRLMTFASMTVRDAQNAIFNLGYTLDQLLKEGCPKAPHGPEPDPSLRRLKAVLTHPIGDYAVQPRDATMAAHGITMTHYMDGAVYTVGSTQNISIRNTSMVREFGGEVFVDAMVKEIIVEKGRAVGVRVGKTSGFAQCTSTTEESSMPLTEIRAKNVVCATSIYNLYNKMLPKDLPEVQKFQDPTQRTIRQSNGHIFLFCKIKGDATELGLPTHNLWYFNGYDLDDAFDKYFADPTHVRPPTVYVGFPCTKDTTWKKRLPGVSNAILISDGLYEWFEKWADSPVKHRGEEYMEFKAKLTNHLLDILYETVPEVKGRVVYHHLGTPLSEVTYLSSYHGGSYGTKCQPEMFSQVNHRWTTTPHTAIPGLYLAGSDAFLPAVCGAMYGGCFGAAAILGHVGTLRLTLAFLRSLAASVREENPKFSWPRSYLVAMDTFLNE